MDELLIKLNEVNCRRKFTNIIQNDLENRLTLLPMKLSTLNLGEIPRLESINGRRSKLRRSLNYLLQDIPCSVTFRSSTQLQGRRAINLKTTFTSSYTTTIWSEQNPPHVEIVELKFKKLYLLVTMEMKMVPTWNKKRKR